MNSTGSARRRWMLAAAVCTGLGIGACAFAQPKPPANKPAAGASASSGLDDRLMGTLVSREMDTLLNHYFQKNNIPADKQAAIKGMQAIKKLADPKLTAGQRKQMFNAGLKGVNAFVAGVKDTESLINVAGIFIEYGMKGQINQIEYFGETPARQAELNEAADGVIKILDVAIKECDTQSQQILAGQTRPNQALLDKWQQLENRMNGAKWTKAFSTYGLCLSVDPANPVRKDAADAAITFLKEFETPDFEKELPAVKVQIGKLLMVKGDYDAAIAKFAEAEKVTGIQKQSLYDAKAYTALTNLMAKKDAAAVKAHQELAQWVEQNYQAEELKGVMAGVGLLEYRINELREDLAKDPARKREFAQAGEAALNKVMKDNPALEPVIKKMLLDKLPANADVTKLDTVLLRALMAKGVDEVLKAREGLADARAHPTLQRAIDAARVVETRKGQTNVSDDALDEAAFFTSVFFAKMDKPVESVTEALHYIQEHGKNKERALHALNTALAGVDVLRKDTNSAGNAKVDELITATWKIAVASGMKEYSFVYGKRLFDARKFKEAAEALAKVPDDHKAIVHARFYQLSAMQQLLNEKGIDPAAKKALVDQVQKLAVDANVKIDAALASAPEDQKPRLMFYKTSAIILGADLMLDETKDYAGVMKMLEGFENVARGLPNEDKLIGSALHLRVNALMALKRTNDAVEEVKKLVAASGDKSARVLFQMLQQMDEDFAAAKKSGDKEQMRTLSAAQASLIKPLIEQTTDVKARNAYKKWDAQLQVRAARNEDNADTRGKYLTSAQGVFTELLGQAKDETPEHDNLRYQLALVSYELKDYKKVQQEMGQLIAMGKLGPPDIREGSPDGTETFRENPVYWEGLLRFMQSNWELSKSDKGPQLVEAIEDHRKALKGFYINRGKNVGGERLAEEYVKLKAELLPGWDETKVVPATQGAK